ncbi:MAG: isoleucine--tRNA ligase [Candidatus Makana argininalis]
MLNYKKTLNLPITSFPMKANLPTKENKILKKWYKEDIYQHIRLNKKKKKNFILHDGPPYANGNIHIGHAVNKIIKDIIIKYKSLNGYNAPYIPGWDCHGLPIELQVNKILGKNINLIKIKDFILNCRKYSLKQVKNQKKDFIRLGVIADWNNPYLTMDFKTEANIIRTFSKIISNNYLYQGLKPIHWCIECKSSLSEAEVEYLNINSTSMYVAFEALNSSLVYSKFSINNLKLKISIIIWTTMPWTLPDNRAIAVNKKFDYFLIQTKNMIYIIYYKLVEKLMLKYKIKKWKIIGKAKGKNLEFLKFKHPFMNFTIPIILSNNINSDMGTGAVHISPSHSNDDYIVSEKYNLEIFDSTNNNGEYIKNTLPELDGIKVLKANKILIKILKSKNLLIYVHKFNHNYPHCWRHKTPIIFRATPQWFINIDKNNLRKKLLNSITNVNWIPKWGKNRIKNMIINRPDWCISRQRVWGIPMSLFVHNETNKIHPRTIEILEIIAKKVEIYGIQAWYDLDPLSMIGYDFINYHKISDTLDIWFDSGSTFFSVLKNRLECIKKKNIDIYLEGSDQHRGWFMSSLIISTIINKKAPYKAALTHGFTVDNKGRKMSKSVGNVFNINNIINTLGADIVRLWVASNDYTNEMPVSEKIIKKSIDNYRKIRNTVRFLLANINDFNPKYHIIKFKDMVKLDIWAISKTKEVQNEILLFYKNYDFHNVVKRIMYFCSIEMSSFYLDIIKDRQYTFHKCSIYRRSCQTAIYHIIESLVRWISPIISFTADEIWDFIPGNRNKNIFLEEWYNCLYGLEEKSKFNNNFWKIIIKIRNEINKIIEIKRKNKIINSSLESCIILHAKPYIYNILKKLGNEIKFIFLTSKVLLSNYDNSDFNSIKCENIEGLKINIIKIKGKKCPRCWHFENNNNYKKKYSDICKRCILNTLGSGEKRKFV